MIHAFNSAHAHTHLAHLGKRARREFCSKKKKEKKKKEENFSLHSAFSLCREVVGAVEREVLRCAAWTGSPERRDGDAGTESSADACGGSERESRERQREAERRAAG